MLLVKFKNLSAVVSECESFKWTLMLGSTQISIDGRTVNRRTKITGLVWLLATCICRRDENEMDYIEIQDFT